MNFWKKCRRFVDGVFMTFMTLITLGVTCGILLTAILVLLRYPLTKFDTSILTWLIVAFCISVVALFYALIAQFCNWKYSKLIMGIIFTFFDLLLLFLGITIFALRNKIIYEVGTLWESSSSQSAVVLYLESYYNCCGFDENTNTHCNNEMIPMDQESIGNQETKKQLCEDIITSSLNTNGNFLASIIFTLFTLLLIVIIFTFISAYRQLKRPEDPELTDIQGQLNSGDMAVWF